VGPAMERTGHSQVPPLPITARVIVRDWLNADSIVLLQPDDNVVVDTGCSSHVDQTLALVRRSEHLGDESLQLVVNTHCHSEHMGGDAPLARTYSCPVAVPEREAPLIRDWDTRALWLDYADQCAERPLPVPHRQRTAAATFGVNCPGKQSLPLDTTWAL
jgi:glyoxylase-like metal-dependent hydrolase (beta-lactamase superfamily II)